MTADLVVLSTVRKVVTRLSLLVQLCRRERPSGAGEGVGFVNTEHLFTPITNNCIQRLYTRIMPYLPHIYIYIASSYR